MSKETKKISRKIKETTRRLNLLESVVAEFEAEKRSFEALAKTELNSKESMVKFVIDTDLMILLNLTGKHVVQADKVRKAKWVAFTLKQWEGKNIALKFIQSKLPEARKIVVDLDKDLAHNIALNSILCAYESTKHIPRKGGIRDMTREKEYVRAIGEFVSANPPSAENLRKYREMLKGLARYVRFESDGEKLMKAWADIEEELGTSTKKSQRFISELAINLETYHGDLSIAKIDDEKNEGAKIKSLKGEAESLAEKIRGLGHAPKVDPKDGTWETSKAAKKAVRGLSEQWTAICTQLREERERIEEKREQKKRAEVLLKRAGKNGENAPEIANDDSLMHILKNFDDLPLGLIRGELHTFEQRLEGLKKARAEILRKAEIYHRICKNLAEKKNIGAARKYAERIEKIERDVQSELSEAVIDNCSDRLYGETEGISKLRDFDRWRRRMPKEIRKSRKRSLLVEMTVQTMTKMVPKYMGQKKVDFDRLELVFNYFQLLIEQAGDMTAEQIKGVAELISKEKYETVDTFFKYGGLIKEREAWMSNEELEQVRGLLQKGQLKKVDRILAGVRTTRGKKAELKSELNWETWSDTRIYGRLKWLLRAFGDGNIRKGLEAANELSMGKPFRTTTTRTAKYVYKALYFIGIATSEGNVRDSQVVVKSLSREQERRLKKVLRLYEIIKEEQIESNGGTK